MHEKVKLDDIISRDDKLRLTLTKLERNLNKVNIGLSSVHSSSVTDADGHNQNDVKVRLPKLTIKNFNGDVAN